MPTGARSVEPQRSSEPCLERGLRWIRPILRQIEHRPPEGWQGAGVLHRYRFTAPLWIWDASGEGAWHFVTLPEDASDEIKAVTDGAVRRGFGSVRVEAIVGPTTWRTSIFPSKERGSYVLPVKKEVRSRAGVDEGEDVAVELTLLLES